MSYDQIHGSEKRAPIHLNLWKDTNKQRYSSKCVQISSKYHHNLTFNHEHNWENQILRKLQIKDNMQALEDTNSMRTGNLQKAIKLFKTSSEIKTYFMAEKNLPSAKAVLVPASICSCPPSVLLN